jgi:hypothetical protein
MKTSLLCVLGALTLPMVACAEKPADQPQGFNAQAGYNTYPQQQGYPPPQQQQGYPGYPPPQQQQQQAAAPPQTAPQAPAPQAPAPQTPAPAPAPAASASSAPANPFPGIPIDPAMLGQISSAGMAVLSPGGVAGDPIEAGIKAAAARFAPNMQPEGQMAKDTLTENAHKAMVVTLAAGKCYTIIGFSPAGQVKNLDLHLLMPPFYNVQAGQDDTADNTPVIGRGGNPTCPVSPFPLQYKLDMHARSGGGQFGVQVFSRSR